MPIQPAAWAVGLHMLSTPAYETNHKSLREDALLSSSGRRIVSNNNGAIYTVSQKTRHYSLVRNFAKC